MDCDDILLVQFVQSEKLNRLIFLQGFTLPAVRVTPLSVPPFFRPSLTLFLGFKKRGRDEKHAGHYYHPYFQRDRPDILGDVRRSYPTGSGNSRSEDDEGDSSGNSTPHPRASFSRGMSVSPGRPRSGSDPKRKAETSVTSNPNKKSPPPPIPPQQHQSQERVRRVSTDGGPEARSNDRGERYAPSYDAYRYEFVGRRPREEDENEASDSRKNAAQQQWPYTGGSVFPDSRHKHSDHQRFLEERRMRHEEEIWINGRGGHGGMGGGAGAGSRMAYMRSNTRVEMPGRHPYAYPATNARVWEAYREQEEPGSSMWYERSGHSRLPPGESSCSAWDMHKSSGGPEFFDGSRSRAMGGTEPRRINYPPGDSSSGGVGRPLGVHPVHRGVPTSTVFPDHYLRQERFGAYSDPHYPPPPVYLPAHTTPDPDVLPTRKSSKWRPVYDESRLGAGGDIIDDERMGGSGSSWSDPSRYARGRGLAAERDGRNAMFEGRSTSSAAHERSREGASAEAAPRTQTGNGGQGRSGTGSSLYRATCEDLPRADDGDISEGAKAHGSRFNMSDTRPVASSPASKGDTVSSRAIMTATS